MRSRHLFRLALIAVAGMGASTPPKHAGAQVATEDEVKAAFVYNFARFVEWPADAMPAGSPTFVVAVIGGGPFGDVLEQALAGKQVLQHRVLVRRAARPDQAAQAQIVFITASEAPRLARILAGLEGTAALTVGDMEDFADQGGMIGFRVEDRKVRFDINARQASRARLKLSSQLLKLARIVGGD